MQKESGTKIFPLLDHLPFVILDENKNIVYHSPAILRNFSFQFHQESGIRWEDFLRFLNLQDEEIEKLNELTDNFFISRKNFIFTIVPMENLARLVIVQKFSEEQYFALELKKRKALIRIINELFRGFEKDDSIEVVLQRVVDVLHQSEFPFYHVGIFLLDDTKKFLYLASLAGKNRDFFQEKYPDGYFQEVSVGILGRTVREGKIQVIPDVKKDPDYIDLDSLPTRSEICIPVYANEQIIGVINIESEEYYFPDEWELTLLENIANYLGLILTNKLLVLELEEKSKEMENYIFEVQEAKERIENQAFDIIQTMEQIEEAKSLIEKQNAIIQKELEMAGNLQKSLITPIPSIKGLEIATWFEPSASLGGDFYDFKMLDENRLLFLQVDVTGHGVSSAILAAMSKIAFQNASENFASPAAVLQFMNQEFHSLNNTDMFLSAFAGLIDLNTKTLYYSNASHPQPFLVRGEQVIELDSDGFLIGVLPDTTFEDKAIRLEKGDVLFIYTDGLIEVKNDQGIQLGKDRVKEMIISNHASSCKEKIHQLVKAVKAFSDHGLEDDLTLISFKITDR